MDGRIYDPGNGRHALWVRRNLDVPPRGNSRCAPCAPPSIGRGPARGLDQWRWRSENVALKSICPDTWYIDIFILIYYNIRRHPCSHAPMLGIRKYSPVSIRILAIDLVYKYLDCINVPLRQHRIQDQINAKRCRRQCGVTKKYVPGAICVCVFLLFIALLL